MKTNEYKAIAEAIASNYPFKETAKSISGKSFWLNQLVKNFKSNEVEFELTSLVSAFDSAFGSTTSENEIKVLSMHLNK